MSALHEKEWRRLYNGTLTNDNWTPQGFIQSKGFPACLAMSNVPYQYIEQSIEGGGVFNWNSGEVGFFPSGYAQHMDYSTPGASVSSICIPDHLLIQAMPKGSWNVFRKIPDPLMQYLFRSALQIRPSEDPLLIDSMTVAIVLRIAYWHTGAYPLISKSTDQIKRSIEYIHDNLSSRITLDDLSAVACMSSFHFSRKFHKVVGRTPHAYVMFKRVERAKRMLLVGALSIASIAYSCGFSSQSHFTTQFRVHERKTPLVFRREMTGINHPA